LILAEHRGLTKRERVAAEKKRILEAISRTEILSSLVIIEMNEERKDLVTLHTPRHLTEEKEKLQAIARQWDESRGISNR
jgi:hypothetical protein